MKKELKKLEFWIDEFLEQQNKKYKDVHMIKHKIEHINRTALLADEFNNDLLRVAMKFHDIGRFKQYELINSYDDVIISHYELGKQVLEEETIKNNIDYSDELEKIKAVVEYHKGIKYISDIIKYDEETLKLVDMATRIDNLDNGCYGVFSYIEDECLNDRKNFKKNNPNLDMKNVSTEVLNFYLNGQSFDKLKYCKTYADYILFAASLAIKSLKGKDCAIAKKIMSQQCGKYKNALDGYKDLFYKFIKSPFNYQCYKFLLDIYNKVS